VIITRSPLRITLGGGGTDLPSYYREHGGFLIAAAIDKYIYITVHHTFGSELIIKYSSLERASSVDEIQHPLIREALKLVNITETDLEISSMADIPAGTGLGSSGSFTTALLRALHMLRNNHISRRELAEQACHIEIERLGEPVGKQDQFIAAFGGIVCLQFHQDGSVTAEPLKIAPEALHNLEDNLLLIFTGFTRAASQILKDQDDRSRRRDREMIENLHFVKQIGCESRQALETGDLRRFAELMHLHWEHKKSRSRGMSNSTIDECYDYARRNGALGGKLIGAGGGGFLLFYTEEKTRLRRAINEAHLREVRWKFDFQGTTVLSQA
jgi:D-glycero-alpha-D-manno-heptose-7-phosphate kinase